jgi:hypothetical protein
MDRGPHRCPRPGRGVNGMAGRARRKPLFASDVRQLGGIVSVHTGRDRSDGEPIFRVGHISAGGDVEFLSLPVMLEDHATAAARILGQFVNAKEIKLAP